MKVNGKMEIDTEREDSYNNQKTEDKAKIFFSEYKSQD